MTAFTGKQIKRARRMTSAEYDVAHAPRFWGRVDRTGDCWMWQGARQGNGYGVLSWHCARRPAHRVAFRLANGAEPEGLEVLHSCDEPRCVNPSHLRAGTHAENMMDVSLHGYHHGAVKTHCPRGHAYEGANLAVWSGRRNCRTCRNMLRNARRRAANPTEVCDAE